MVDNDSSPHAAVVTLLPDSVSASCQAEGLKCGPQSMPAHSWQLNGVEHTVALISFVIKEASVRFSRNQNVRAYAQLYYVRNIG